jgi:hypothetical protein
LAQKEDRGRVYSLPFRGELPLLLRLRQYIFTGDLLCLQGWLSLLMCNVGVVSTLTSIWIPLLREYLMGPRRPSTMVLFSSAQSGLAARSGPELVARRDSVNRDVITLRPLHRDPSRGMVAIGEKVYELDTSTNQENREHDVELKLGDRNIVANAEPLDREVIAKSS